MPAFSPIGATVNIAVTGSAQTLTFTQEVSGATNLRLANVGTQTVFVRTDGVTATAAAGMPILANSVEVIDKGSRATLSVIAGATGSTLYATTGFGE